MGEVVNNRQTFGKIEGDTIPIVQTSEATNFTDAKATPRIGDQKAEEDKIGEV